jgi:hypothetical protein
MQCYNCPKIDYDECNPASSIHIQDCGTMTTCTNEVGTYSCQCAAVYEGTPHSCTGMYMRCKTIRSGVTHIG